MRTLMSRPSPSQHLVLARLPEGAGFLAQFVDERQPRDITDGVADLLLTGLIDALEQKASGRPEPEDQVEVAHLAYVAPPTAPGAVLPPATFTWLHLGSGQCGDLDPESVLPLLQRGVSVALTEGVAAEAADVPESSADLPASD